MRVALAARDMMWWVMVGRVGRLLAKLQPTSPFTNQYPAHAKKH
jgi:hypothetical protein